jgi:hypothetical protein
MFSLFYRHTLREVAGVIWIEVPLDGHAIGERLGYENLDEGIRGTVVREGELLIHATIQLQPDANSVPPATMELLRG